MNYNAEKVDALVLALLHLTSSSERGVVRAWKGHDWDALDRLHQKGLISDPKSKAKSLCLATKVRGERRNSSRRSAGDRRGALATSVARFAGLGFLGDVIPGLRSLRSLTRG